MEVKKLIKKHGGQAAFFRKVENTGISHSTVRKWSSGASEPKKWVVTLIDEYLKSI